jgi:hypothetical protein
VAGLGSGPPVVDPAAGRVTLPVANAPGILPELAARLSAADLRFAELALRRPTLDEVFLTLTGQPAAGTAHAAHNHRDPSTEAGAASR